MHGEDGTKVSTVRVLHGVDDVVTTSIKPTLFDFIARKL
jgi:hypothetical protein